MRVRLLRPLLPLLACLVLPACCRTFSLSEPGAATVTRITGREAELEVDYSCWLAADLKAPLERACRLLEDQEANLLELDRRHEQALTPEEKARLATLRQAALDRLFGDAAQLNQALEQLDDPDPTARVSVILAVDSVDQLPRAQVAAIDTRAPLQASLRAHFSHLAVVRPADKPLGVVLSCAPAQALGFMAEAMRAHAQAEGYLRPETQSALD